MKPVAIFQHTEVGHPGAVLAILDQLHVPWEIIRIVDGAPVPAAANAYAGLIFMGGAMGVNDGLAWMDQEVALIRRAVAAHIPVAAHCLGSQILAHALGATVRRNATKEIGWQAITLADSAVAALWFDRAAGETLEVFQWHGDTFDMPPGAQKLASSAYCSNQAYLYHGMHLGMQFHLEMTPELIAHALQKNGHELQKEVNNSNPAANTLDEARHDVEYRTAAMHRLLLSLYTQWIRQLKSS